MIAFYQDKTIYIYLLFSVLMFLLVPPMLGYDEPNHILRAWQISEGQAFKYQFQEARTNWIYFNFFANPELNDKLNPVVKTIGTSVPKRLLEIIDHYNFKHRTENKDWGNFFQHRQEIYQELNQDLELAKTESSFTAIPNTIFYPPTAYLQYQPTLWLAKLLNLKLLPLYTLLKLANYLITLPLVIWFFKENRVDKTPQFNIFILNFLVLATNTTVNVDGLLLTGAIIMVVNFIKSYFGIGEKNRLLSINLLLLSIIILIKPIFFSLAILYLPHMTSLRKLNKRCWGFFAGALSLALGQYLIYLIKVGEIFPYRTAFNNNIAVNKTFYFSNFYWLKQIPITILDNFYHFNDYLTPSIGIKEDASVGLLILFTTTLSTILIVLRAKQTPVKFARLTLISAYLLNLLLVYLFVNLTWLGVHDYKNSTQEINPIMVRYFYFTLPLFFAAIFYNKKIRLIANFPKFHRLLSFINILQIYFLLFITLIATLSLNKLW